MKAILTDAVAVGNAAARSILFASRDERAKVYPDRQWFTAFIGGSYAFEDHGERMLDARTLFHYYATGITPAMAAANPGTGSAYAVAARDAQGRYFDGGKTYKITLPAPPPANSGRLRSTTTRRARCLKPTRNLPASTATNPLSGRILTDR